MLRVGIYSRKSKFSASGDSVQNQVQLCREYVEKNLGPCEISVYEDEGYSGKNANRPMYTQMLRDAKNGLLDVILCYRLDRISRNITDFSSLIQLLQDHNVEFISIREHFDTTTPMGRAMLYIASIFAQLERETIAERIRDNMLQLAKTGRWLGGRPPFGFAAQRVFQTDDTGKLRQRTVLIPIADEQEKVRLIFKHYIECGNLTELRKWCSTQGFKPKGNNNTFNKGALKSILENPVYASADLASYGFFAVKGVFIANSKEEFDGSHGMLIYNRHSSGKRKGSRENPPEEWIISISDHAPVIDGNTWVRVQEMLLAEHKNHFAGEKETKYPGELPDDTNSASPALLTGRLFCSCGNRMQIKYRSRYHGRQYYYYCCSRKSAGKKVCPVPNLSGLRADRDVWDKLVESILSEARGYESLCRINAGNSIYNMGFRTDMKEFLETLGRKEKRMILGRLIKRAYWDGTSINIELI